MDYTTTQKRDYAWIAQASYFDFQGLLPYDTGLGSKLKNTLSVSSAKMLADEQINFFVESA